MSEGTIQTGKIPQTGKVRSRCYRDGKLVLEDFPLEQVAELLRDPASVLWLDLDAPEPAELDAVAELLGLHQLAVEDALNEHQRPKLDRYEGHLFMSAYRAVLDTSTGEVELGEVDAFVMPRTLVTVREGDRFPLDPVLARWDRSSDLACHGVGFLLYGLLDEVVDGHFVAVQELDDSVERLEDLLFEEGRAQIREVQERSFALRKSLVALRRVVLPMREVVNSLMRPDLALVDEPMQPYYRDVYDHVLRATEQTESLRDLVTTIVETNLTVQGNRMNLIMKKVTSWAAIIAVPTAITGFFGQNLPFPGYAGTKGLIASCALIILSGAALYALFRRKDWV